MPFFQDRLTRKSGKRTVLERRTAELKEKLAKISFRRHSAPAQPSARGSGEAEEPAYFGGTLTSTVVAPVVLCDLPPPILDKILGHLTLKELTSSAALVHSSWRKLILNEELWRRRLDGKLPQELVSHFNHWHSTWIRRATRFFSQNLIANPEFSPQRISVATGLGKGMQGGGAWRVQVSCWHTEAMPGASGCGTRAALCRSGQPDLRALSLFTPTWATPEAFQKVNLLERLTSQGMSPVTAAAYLDTCPALHFSVWSYTGRDQPTSWQRGYAVCVLDNGRDSGTGWLGLREGSRVSMHDSAAYWISWAPEDSLLRGCTMLPRQYASTPRGEFKRLACVFQNYPKGVRRAHVLLKGLSPQHVYPGSHGRGGQAKHVESASKPYAEFVAPCLRFAVPEA